MWGLSAHRAGMTIIHFKVSYKCSTRSGNPFCARTPMLPKSVQSSTNRVVCEEERAK